MSMTRAAESITKTVSPAFMVISPFGFPLLLSNGCAIPEIINNYKEYQKDTSTA
jgi:hypothetical protein